MPESTVKYYPVLARILLLLEGNPIITFRAAIITRCVDWVTDYRVVHRFVLEYKGKSFTATAQAGSEELRRDEALLYLERKCSRHLRLGVESIEPVVEVDIPLRGVVPKQR